MSNFIMTYSSNIFDYNNVSNNTVSLIDIAAALSKICRFGGHSINFYPVLAHCLLVSHIAEEEMVNAHNDVYALYGLLHDASEAYVSDLMSPLKRVVGDDYKAIENEIEQKIYQSLVPHHDEWVGVYAQLKVYDALAFFVEQQHLLMMPKEQEENILAYYNQKFGITEWMVMEAREKYSSFVTDKLSLFSLESIKHATQELEKEYIERYAFLSPRVRSVRARAMLEKILPLEP